MQIIEGQLPESNKTWQVLFPRSPQSGLGKSWQLALLLAKAGLGQVITVITVTEQTEEQMTAARELMHTCSQNNGSKVKIYPIIVLLDEYERRANEFIIDQNIDVLVDDISDPIKHDLNHCQCAVAAVRGDPGGDSEENIINRIAVPTSGGPNTLYALNTLMAAAPEVEIVAVYIAREELGENEVALGQSRLRQALDFIDGQGKVKSDLIEAKSISDGITQIAKDYDLVVIGASRESSVDKLIFGNIPDLVVRDSKSTVVVFREPNSRVSHVMGEISWRLQKYLPRLNLEQRTEAYVRIRRAARPTLDYYILISLSAIISGLGLVANSAAVVIGAMLVAPLMSPIVGTGLSTVLGDVRFLRLTLGAVLRGALLAVIVGMIVGIFQIGDPLTAELLARTEPSLLDLAIALFSGIAAAFALSRSNAAAALPGVAIAAALVPPLATIGITLTAGFFIESFGATLLFITNFVAIGTATALVFIILGYRPGTSQKERRRVRARSAKIALVSLIGIAILLIGTSYFLSQSEAKEQRIREVVENELREIASADLQDLDIVSFSNGHLVIDITARSTQPISFQTSLDLQEAIGGQLVADRIIDDIAMTMTVIRVTNLDPLIPPTPTPGPSPTPAPTPLPTATPEPVLGTGVD